MQGRGGEELSAELTAALEGCLLGGKSGAGIHFKKERKTRLLYEKNIMSRAVDQL